MGFLLIEDEKLCAINPLFFNLDDDYRYEVILFWTTFIFHDNSEHLKLIEDLVWCIHCSSVVGLQYGKKSLFSSILEISELFFTNSVLIQIILVVESVSTMLNYDRKVRKLCKTTKIWGDLVPSLTHMEEKDLLVTYQYSSSLELVLMSRG